MEATTFTAYKSARKLQYQALETMNRLELLADHGVKKASRQIDAAWVRYNRRTMRVNIAADLHWGEL